MAMVITFMAGISILVGALVIRMSKNPEKIERLSIALALGSLLSLMIFDLSPEIVEKVSHKNIIQPIVFVILGAAILKILDIFLPDHDDTKENHDKENAAHIGLIAAFAVILHNILEGMTIYSLSLTSVNQGIIFAIGISLHNIPMGMLIYSTIDDKKRREKSVILSVVTGATLIGGILMAFISGFLSEGIVLILLCVATGMIAFIVFDELLPHVLRTRPIKPSIIGAVAGFVLVFISCQIAG
ncbi:MAG: ZIP family metal transporter [Lachnospiraceae bacterium]|nr:ZIP family metal transporter [Lachnospiraceae bacterium]